MISFFYETDFKLSQVRKHKKFFYELIENEGFTAGDINYIFCDDNYILEINQKYLNHDYYTDVIGFQYEKGIILKGDIYISIERLVDNAKINQVPFIDELIRVMIHGILHFMNYGDKTDEEIKIMRAKENEYLTLNQKMFHVEQSGHV